MTGEHLHERSMVLRGGSSSDRFACAALARAFAEQMGLSSRACGELAIAAAELGSNVARHAAEGRLTVRYVAAPAPHILLVCSDRGPGIGNIAAAKADGYSKGRQLEPDAPRCEGIGFGLGAIARLVDELDIDSTLDVGTTVTAKKWIR
jgi:serine/threonine-protein kinase RsbT